MASQIYKKFQHLLQSSPPSSSLQAHSVRRSHSLPSRDHYIRTTITMAIQIYGIPVSVAVRRALVAFKELNVPYELIIVDAIKGENKSPEHVQFHPFGKIPYMRDPETGLALYESRAMARYIVNKYDEDGKSGLIPHEAVAAAKFEQAAAVEITRYEPHVNRLAEELFYKPRLLQLETDDAVVTKSLAGLNQTLDVYDDILSKQKYLAGDFVTLADLFHLPVGTLLTESVKLDVLTTDTRPNVQRWWKDISSRPSWVVISGDRAPLA
ncbi:hypothetical protein EIP91_007358 [Steccherinum ochraceum]|uniref:glutathione transferase n=1 Tax=Steccherinum ochraceum TaxID=92696 RepID=A0A4R0RS08_9APHY|nr:hypothetical protein EIP91_007358 [Steccherinum ochraceum]